MRWKRMPAIVAGLTLFAASISDAVADRVRGTETCTSGSYDRTIGGKKYTCASKCTTPITETTCQSGRRNCTSRVIIETSYKDCTEKARTTRPTLGVTQPPGILETAPLEGGRQPSPTGRPVAPATPGLMLR